MATMRACAPIATTCSMKRPCGKKPSCALCAPLATIGFISSSPMAAAILQSVFFREWGRVAFAVLVAQCSSAGSDPFGVKIIGESLKVSGTG
eukprot:1353099-Pyramimonas_sp.AAC.1